MAYISKFGDLDGSTYDLRSKITNGILYAQVDSTSTSTAFTVQIPGVTEYYDGLTILLKNGVVTSATNFTINVNGLGAKKSYTNLAAATADTTIFNVSYTMLFIYDSTRVSGGGWICYRGYDANTNTIGYQLRTNSTALPVTDTARYYKLYFAAPDGGHWVPASVNSTNNATTARAVNQRPINPFGRIVYTSASTNYTAGTNLAATTLWDQYVVTLGYSFNVAGGELSLLAKTPVYLKCAPQSDGSAIMDATTPIVQDLPSTEDGKIYIYLGIATDATHIELFITHPIYYFKNEAMRLWTNQVTSSVIIDSEPTEGSTNAVSSGSVYANINDLWTTIDPINIELDISSSIVGDKTYYTASVQESFADLATKINAEAKTIFYAAIDGIKYLFVPSKVDHANERIHLGAVCIDDAGTVHTANVVLTAVTTSEVEGPLTFSALADSEDIPTVPTNVSSFTNDSGYLTSSTGVTSVNGNTGAVTVTVPTNVSSFTNDSGYLTSSTGVTSVNGNTGAVTVTVPTNVSSFTNDSGYLTLATLPRYNGGVS